ncbi:MAG: 2Fe-2S iron-sulfur cluster-binding protein [Rhizomicrobium sp.]
MKITYIEFNGDEHVVDVKPGLSVMEGARNNNIPGIDADCGGACATRHVFVDPAWQSKTGVRTVMEESMLEFSDSVRPNSRLSCQMPASTRGLEADAGQAHSGRGRQGNF